MHFTLNHCLKTITHSSWINKTVKFHTICNFSQIPKLVMDFGHIMCRVSGIPHHLLILKVSYSFDQYYRVYSKASLSPEIIWYISGLLRNV